MLGNDDGSGPVRGHGSVVPEVEHVFREEFGRIVASLTHRFGSLDLAEDMAQEAILEAINRWPDEGVPANPGAWLTVTARNRAVDHLRRESTRDQRQRAADALAGRAVPDPADEATDLITARDDQSCVEDERLRLFFLCCHPALAPDSQTALILRLLGGLDVAEVASAHLVPERTMAQRLTRAKRKIRGATIPFRMPADPELPGRLSAVLQAVYLVFNEGYLPSSPEAALRVDLCEEAIRLGRLLRSLMPDEPEVTGLLALMLLAHARTSARVRDGVLVTLDEQDRGLWNRALIDEGHVLVRECLARNRPGPYQLQAAISAVHTDAPTAGATDWRQVLDLYDQLVRLLPTPVVQLNRAVAVAEVEGPGGAITIVDRLDLAGYHPWHAVRADLLRRLGRLDEARAEYDAAIRAAGNPAEVAWLGRRRDGLPSAASEPPVSRASPASSTRASGLQPAP